MNKPVLAYIGIGSNLHNPSAQIKSALQKIAALPSTTLLRCSPWYASKAMGLDRQINKAQPDYINGAVAIETTLTPHDLLQALQGIERAQGRTREVRWAARTLDLDILLYGDQNIHSPELEIPHPRILERNFVLAPLADLDPTLTVKQLTGDSPGSEKNETITDALARLPNTGLQLLSE